jgi:molybdopterin/thiamine biosynthesis adenylyltransferase
MSPEDLEVIGLLVPDEPTYRKAGESWVFLLRMKLGRGRSTRRSVISLGTQYLSRSMLSERTPLAKNLADKSVVVVGLGSLGMPIALDLAQSGLGKITVLDKDFVDPSTMTRQSGGALALAGTSKASLAALLIEESAPYCAVRAISGAVEHLWDTSDRPEVLAASRTMRQALASADVVVDATGVPPVARVLDRIRSSAGKPLVVVSGTAGGWGGVVAKLTPATGCWACVEHARLEGALPVPPTDPEGWVAPTRCASLTFVGARHQMQQLAMHASAVTIAHLVGDDMPGDYHVAAMRTVDARPMPIAWTSVALPIHRDCPLHNASSTDASAKPTPTVDVQ